MAETSPSPISLFVASIGGVEQLCVKARPMHRYLGTPNKFIRWFNEAIQKFKLQQHVDFESTFDQPQKFKETVNKDTGSEPPFLEDFYFSLKIAVMLSASEKTPNALHLHACLLSKIYPAADESLVPTDSSVNLDSSHSAGCINTEQLKTIKGMMEVRSRRTQQHPQTIWTEFKKKFKISSYSDLPMEKFNEGCDFLQRPHAHDAQQNSFKFDAPPEIQSLVERMTFSIVGHGMDSLKLAIQRYLVENSKPHELSSTDYVRGLLSSLCLREILR